MFYNVASVFKTYANACLLYAWLYVCYAWYMLAEALSFRYLNMQCKQHGMMVTKLYDYSMAYS